MRLVVCLVTDRSRLAPGVTVVEQARRAAAAGVTFIQVRERDLETSALVTLVGQVVDATAGSPVRVLVNDRFDVALAAGAHGVHLRATSAPAERLRPHLPPGFIVGRSVHSPAEARLVHRAGGVDFLLFGHVWTTRSKPGVAPAGVEALTEVVQATPLPVLGIGGVAVERIDALGAAGAAGFAAIDLFRDPRDIAAVVSRARRSV